jgi:hypothetical protein
MSGRILAVPRIAVSFGLTGVAIIFLLKYFDGPLSATPCFGAKKQACNSDAWSLSIASAVPFFAIAKASAPRCRANFSFLTCGRGFPMVFRGRPASGKKNLQGRVSAAPAG